MYHYSLGYLQTTATDVLRCDGGPLVVISLWATNTSGANSDWYLYHVPADEDLSDIHGLVFNEQIRPKLHKEDTVPIILKTGDRLMAKATDANAVTISIYAIPYTDYVRSI